MHFSVSIKIYLTFSAIMINIVHFSNTVQQFLLLNVFYKNIKQQKLLEQFLIFNN